MPETPHFLVTKGRHKETEKLFKKIAKINGKKLPDDLLAQLKEDEEAAMTEKFRDILKAPVLLKRFLVFIYLWQVLNFYFFNLKIYVTTKLVSIGTVDDIFYSKLK